MIGKIDSSPAGWGLCPYYSAPCQPGIVTYNLEFRRKIHDVLVGIDRVSNCGRNSVGRVQPCQGCCRGFESLRPLFFYRMLLSVSAIHDRVSDRSHRTAFMVFLPHARA